MVDSGMGDSHALAFASAWKKTKEDQLKRVKNQSTFGSPFRLDSVDWNVHLQMKGSTPDIERVKPKAILQMNLQDCCSEDKRQKDIKVELDRKQLEDMFNDLETIQSQLDALT